MQGAMERVGDERRMSQTIHDKCDCQSCHDKCDCQTSHDKYDCLACCSHVILSMTVILWSQLNTLSLRFSFLLGG